MVLADHVVWKHKDALEETRNANYSTAKFLKVRCSVIILICPYLVQEWIYSVQTEGNKNNSVSMMAQFPSLALTCSSVFLFLWVFDNSEAFSNSVLKQFWLICVYFLKESKFANSTNSSVVFKLVRSLVRNVNVVAVVIFSLNTASLNECG